MNLELRADIEQACRPLFERIPLETAMNRLLGSHSTNDALVERVTAQPVIAAAPSLVAGLWLYADNLERSHTVSQGIDDVTGSFWHGIMHRREGDFSNSHYWLRRAASHPLLLERPDLDPGRLVDDVAAAHGENPPDLVERQRMEWKALFEWAARTAAAAAR